VEADVCRAASTMGWKPRVSFEDGLAETLRWARNSLANPLSQSGEG